MLKNIWFQIHWLLGITAGIVLAIVGVTGAALSFEHDLLRWMNPGVMTVPARDGGALPPAELMARVQAASPGKRIVSLTLSASPEDAARVNFAAPPGAGKGPGAKRGEARYLDPYTGELLGKPRGEAFMRLMMQVHRWLAAGDTGKAIVGASTIALVVLCLSGLYLRWPRNILNWRTWLTLDFKRKGRSFLWDLHAVAGTWALLLYLLAALTGLYWSYDWYRDGLFKLTGAPRPAQQGVPRQASDGAAGKATMAGTAAGQGERRSREKLPAPPANLALAWDAFLREAGQYSTATLRLPEKAGQAVQISYLDAQPAHERATNRLLLDAQSGAVIEHERYADKPVGAKLMSSMLVLHSGSFFGLPGLILMMLASLMMPLFAISGWMLYLDRRKKKKALRITKAVMTPADRRTETTMPEMLIGFASQTGFAEQIAWQTAGALQTAGVPVTVQPLGRITREGLSRFRHALFIVSTFGEGEAPDHARPFARLMGKSLALDGLRFGLLALGDRQYKTFCGFGHALDHWLRSHGAQALFERVEVDRGDLGALHDWQKRLGMLADIADAPAWTDTPFAGWILRERRLLNPGSVGGPTYHLELQAPEASLADWHPGDLVDILPDQPDQAAAQPLSQRQYSIASVKQDGSVHLLVRQVGHDGGLGLGSGWLTVHAPLGGSIRMRIHRNPGFHPPAGEQPLILIGNGTGLAGLRSHLRARVLAGKRRNWLIFGERNSAHDFYYRDDIEAWQKQGMLERLDLVFSRDQVGRRYVQDCVRDHAAAMRVWLAEGATIMVCGSLEGMAPGVEAALTEIIGADGVDRLLAEGRYRRDVY